MRSSSLTRPQFADLIVRRIFKDGSLVDRLASLVAAKLKPEDGAIILHKTPAQLQHSLLTEDQKLSTEEFDYIAEKKIFPASMLVDGKDHEHLKPDKILGFLLARGPRGNFSDLQMFKFKILENYILGDYEAPNLTDYSTSEEYPKVDALIDRIRDLDLNNPKLTQEDLIYTKEKLRAIVLRFVRLFGQGYAPEGYDKPEILDKILKVLKHIALISFQNNN